MTKKLTNVMHYNNFYNKKNIFYCIMDDFYYKKYCKYKLKYLKIKNIDNLEGGGKKCLINDDDVLLFGDGGSTAIVVITKDKRIYKIFTLYNYLLNVDLKNDIKRNNKMVDNEINIIKLITENIVNKNISHHYVKYIGSNNCTNASLLFNKCPKSYIEFMKIDDEKKTKMCKMFYKRYPGAILDNKYKVVEVEYCDYSCSDFIKNVSLLSIFEMETYLDIFFFQIIYTIVLTQKKYPYFVHGDLFIRNILGTKEKDNGNYYVYKFNNKKYFVPQKNFFPKINDFGLTNLN